MTVDLRRFAYPMEPLRRLRRWKLEALLLKLGRIQKEIREAEGSLVPLKALHAEVSQAVVPGIRQPIDPDRQRRHLGWLARLRACILDTQTHLETLRTARKELQQAFLAEQSRVDVLDRHYKETREAFAQHEHGRQIAEMDRDWLTRIASPQWGLESGGGA